MKSKKILALLLAVTIMLNGISVVGAEIVEEESVESYGTEQYENQEETESDMQSEIAPKSEENTESEENKESSGNKEPEDKQGEKTGEKKVDEQDAERDLSEDVSQEEVMVENNSVTNQASISGDYTDLVFADDRIKSILLRGYDKDGDGHLSSVEMDGIAYLTISGWDIYGTDCLDLEGIQYLKNLKDVYIDTANKVTIKNADVLEQNKNVYYLTLKNAGITDITFVKNMTKLSILDLSGNKISDLTPLVEANLEGITLKNNVIQTLPENWTNLTSVGHLDLSENLLTTVKQLAFRDYYMGYFEDDEEYVTDISNNSGLSAGIVFDEVYQSVPLSVVVGNSVRIPVSYMVNQYLNEQNKISYSVVDESIAEVDENGRVFGKISGKTTVIASIGGYSKEIPVEIIGSIAPVETEVKYTPEVQAISDECCAVCDANHVLWELHNTESEKIAEDVKSYTVWHEFTTGDGDGTECGTYYVLNKDNTLLSYSKKDGENTFAEKEILKNVKSYEISAVDGKLLLVLTENGELYDYKGLRLLARQVEKYFYSIDENNNLVYSVIYTKLRTVIINENEVIQGVDEVDFSSQGNICYYRQVNELYAYGEKDKKSCKISDNVDYLLIGAETENEFEHQFMSREGRRYKYYYWWNESENTYVSEVYEIDASEPYLAKKVLYYWPSLWFTLDANNILWRSAVGQLPKVVAKDVDDFDVLPSIYDQECLFIKGNSLYTATWDDIQKIADNVKEFTDYYYLTTDGIVHELIYSDLANNMDDSIIPSDKGVVLSDVVDIAQRDCGMGDYDNHESCYMVRKDGSIWKYDSVYATNNVPYMIKNVTIKQGDIDGDFEVKISDLIRMLHHIAGKEILGTSQQEAADIDGDGSVSIRDLLRMLHFISGTSSEL